jgi:NAD(P) transhydrogenase subunit alpha
MGKAENFNINMEDDVVKRAMVTYNGQINWPPEPLAVSPQKTAASAEIAAKPELSSAVKARKKTVSAFISLTVIGGLLYLMGNSAPPEFMGHFTVFVLAVFVGWQIIWNVSHSLHTPLMAVTNAISGIIVTGGLLQINKDWNSPLTILAFVAVLVASINIVGGFLVTHRMLKMFRK